MKRVFITDEAELLPRYLRFVRGIVDTSDLPLNISREMIQESPVLAAIRKSVTSCVLTTLEKMADYERREQLLKLARFRTTASGEATRSLTDYVAAMEEGQSPSIISAAPVSTC